MRGLLSTFILISAILAVTSAGLLPFPRPADEPGVHTFTWPRFDPKPCPGLRPEYYSDLSYTRLDVSITGEKIMKSCIFFWNLPAIISVHIKNKRYFRFAKVNCHLDILSKFAATTMFFFVFLAVSLEWSSVYYAYIPAALKISWRR